MSDLKIGFIGLGTMGESMCENIIKKLNISVNLYDMVESQVKKLADIGGNPCIDISDVTKNSDVIIIMVPKNDDVRNVIEKIIPVMKKDTIIIDMSTISPKVSRELALKVKNAGGVMIDAPVVKSKGAAISGELGILVGGDKSILEKVRYILECMGSEITYMGGNGNGLVLKLIHNMLVGNIQNGVNEAILMAESAGLDFDDTIKGIKSGGGQNFYMDGKNQSIKNGDFTPKFSVQNMYKDVWLHKELADELGLSLPGSERVREIYDETMKNSAKEDFSATIKTVRNLCKK